MANETIAETIVEKWDSSMFGGWKCEMDKAAADCTRCGMYLERWCIEPIKLLICSNVLGGDSFSMASAFLVNGVCPRYLCGIRAIQFVCMRTYTCLLTSKIFFVKFL